VNKCYFQSTRLITFVHDELLRFFTHQFISERSALAGDILKPDGDYIVSVAHELRQFLQDLKSSKDKWLSTCGVFLEMSQDFLEFVEAYRIGDAIAIEYGYKKFSPVWKANKQHKYVEIWLGQQETLYRDNVYSRLQELRLNRVVRRYAATTGKRCVAQDEFLEHGNRFFSEFPMPKSLVGFASQSLYVGVGLMSKQFSARWYTTKFKDEDETPTYSSTVKPCMTPEKKLVYQAFSLLKTHVSDPSRTSFEMGYVMSIEKQLTVDLKRDVLERSMKGAPETSADKLLTSLSTTYQESIDNSGVDSAEELDDGDKDELDVEESSDGVEGDSSSGYKSLKTTKISNKKINPLMGKDVYKIGRDLLAEKDIVAIRAEAARRREKKSSVRACIMKSINEMVNGLSFEMPNHLKALPSWQQHVRSHPNNLGLK